MLALFLLVLLNIASLLSNSGIGNIFWSVEEPVSLELCDNANYKLIVLLSLQSLQMRKNK